MSRRCVSSYLRNVVYLLWFTYQRLVVIEGKDCIGLHKECYLQFHSVDSRLMLVLLVVDFFQQKRAKIVI